MIYKCLIVACFCLFFLSLSFQNCRKKTKLTPIICSTNIETPFPSFCPEYAQTEWWQKQDRKYYPIFELSQNYPSDKPVEITNNKVAPWNNSNYDIIFKTNEPKDQRWNKGRQYLIDIVKQAFDENISKDGNIENDWIIPDKTNAKWFHAPWLHSDAYFEFVAGNQKNCVSRKDGREFVHGLTAERNVNKVELNGNVFEPAPMPTPSLNPTPCQEIQVMPPETPDEPIQNWGIAFFNAPGGYTIKKVWNEIINPDDSNLGLNLQKISEIGFPYGTVVIKLLFTEARNNEAYYLDASDNENVSWFADINRAKECIEILNKKAEECQPQKLRLLQIDVAVRDKRADDFSGWVFGTFTYNKEAKGIFGENIKYDNWEKIEPIGLMFGNDREIKQGETDSKNKLKETLHNNSLTIKQHLGCGGRMNGPVDNPRSSCLACHRLAQVSEKFKFIDYGDAQCKDETNSSNKSLNIRSGDIYNPQNQDLKMYSLHFILQLQIGMVRFCRQHPSHCGIDENQIKQQNLLREISR